MDPAWLILIGLGLDIIGVIFIIKPILRRKLKYSAGEAYRESDPLYAEGGMPRFAKKLSKDAIITWIGLIFLISGFILQIVGNAAQSPQIFNFWN